jgi:hypothetical protein
MQSSQIPTDVPGQIFEKFVEELKVSGFADEALERFRKTFLKERNITETAIKTTIFPNT